MVKDLWLIGTRHLLTQPARTLLTIAGIALGVSLSVAIQTANVDVLRAFEQAVTTVAGRATLQVSAGESDLDERLIAEIRRHPAVLSAMPVLQRVAQVREGPAEGNSLVIYGLDLLEAGNLKDFTIDVGEPPAVTLETLLRPDGLFVGEDLARRSGIQVGQTLRILVGTRVYQVTVLGVVRPVAGLASAWASLAVMDIAAAQALFDAVGRLDRIELVTGPTSAIEAVRKDLTGLLPPGVAVQRPAQRNEQVEHMLRAFQLNLTTLSAVGLLVGILLVYNTVSFNVVQRRREIGIVRALGMPRPRVASLFLAESALMGLLGGLAGTGLGVLLATVIVQLMTRTVSELYMPVPAQPGVKTFLPPQVGLIGVGLGVVVSMIGALAPSLTAGRTAPARALAYGDYEAVQGARTGSLAVAGGVLLAGAALLALPGPVRGIPVFGYGSALTLLLGLACFAPGLVQATGALAARGHTLVARIGRPVGLARLAADQVGRAPGRNAVTVATLMIGIAIMVGVGVMIHSFRQTVNAWITQTIMADLIIVPATWLKTDDPRALGKGIPPKWIEAVGQVPGVAAIDPYRERRIEHGDRPLA
ncbi:MAG: ABC transporter permease, partial [Nitrospirales bacterium]